VNITRYLRTVRVTAAVYWTFDFKREPVLFGIQHRAGVRPYTSCYHLAESCVFSKQSLPPILCHHAYAWSSIFQRYGGNLPSSFNIRISSPECTYTNSPVLVWGTVICMALCYFLDMVCLDIEFHKQYLDIPMSSHSAYYPSAHGVHRLP
ncbi:hypothetical protein PSENEW3_20000018, partial (mitochondrion) [Picochlorum sp. SENEW3]